MAIAGIALLCPLFAATEGDDAGDKATFQKVCGACHTTTIAGDLKTEAEWAETVANMMSIGAKATDEDFEGVLRYLARNLTKVNVNTAPAAQIAPVLAITEKTAQALVDYRAQNGPFTSLEALKRVPGLEGARLEARKDRIAFR